MTAPWRGALVGFGMVAERAHAPAFASASGFDIAAVAESNPERMAAARAAFPHARLYGSLEELLATEERLDFADITTPPFLHGQQAPAALAAGLHVLCEKPLTLDPVELERLACAAAEAGRCLYAVHNWAYSPQWLEALALARNLGPLRRVELTVERSGPARGSGPDPWRRDVHRAGGGILVDHGWHCLYLVHRLLGPTEDVRVVSFLRPDPSGAEEEAVLRLGYPRAEAVVRLTWRGARRSNTARIEGERGILELSDDRLLFAPEAAAAQTVSFAEKLSAASAHPEWHRALLEDFRLALIFPGTCHGNVAEARFCCRAIAAAYRQAGEAAAA